MKIHKNGDRYSFWCPGCNCVHAINSTWTFNGNLEQPTISPSVLVTTGHYAPHAKQNGVCWCTYNAEHPDKPAPFKCGICHSFVREGKIQFLSDCTHSFAGQTVALPDWED